MKRPASDNGQPRPSYSPLAFVRSAARLLRRSPSYPRRQIRKRVLRAAYLKGWAAQSRALPEEEPDHAIIEAGALLRQQVLDANDRKHRKAPYRVLMLHPSSITADVWFGGLQQCMQHAGIECRILPPGSPATDVNESLEAFRPNILIAVESTAILQSLDLEFIRDYKRRHGCLRLFIPVWRLPKRFSIIRDRELRRSLHHKGLLADAHFSIFEPEFHERFKVDRDRDDIEYVTVAQACNPFTDRPLPERKVYDYFMATSLTDERLEVTYRFLRPLMSRYRGLWAGPRWGFGRTGVPLDEMATSYAQTRVSLSPLVGYVTDYAAELTHRIYAAAACGAFQLTMPTAITSRYFEPDELVQAGSPEEYTRLFEHYVDRPDERNAVALRALRRAYGAHTCFHRVDRLVEHWNDWQRRGLF